MKLINKDCECTTSGAIWRPHAKPKECVDVRMYVRIYELCIECTYVCIKIHEI